MDASAPSYRSTVSSPRVLIPHLLWNCTEQTRASGCLPSRHLATRKRWLPEYYPLDSFRETKAPLTLSLWDTAGLTRSRIWQIGNYLGFASCSHPKRAFLCSSVSTEARSAWMSTPGEKSAAQESLRIVGTRR